MVQDNEIIAESSPFRRIEGEKKVYDSFNGYASINQVIAKIERNHMGEFEIEILKIVNEYKFVTSRQITQLLEKIGYVFENPKKIPKKLDAMLKDKLLARCYFSTVEEKSAYKVYSLEKNGKYLLEAKGIKSDWKITDNIKNITSIKKRLATNQMMISYILKQENLESSKTDISFESKKYGRRLVVKGEITLKGDKNAQKHIFIEPVRRDEKEEQDTIDRFKIFTEILEKEKNTDLVVLCEDKKHMAEIYKLIVVNKIEIPNLYFTYDLAQIEEDLSKTIYQFEIKDSGIDMINASFTV